MPSPKNYKQINLFYSPQQWVDVLRRAEKLKMKPHTYVRNISVFGEIKIYNLADVIDLTTAINRVGNNINQVVKMINETRSVNGTDFELLKKHLEEIETEIEEYIRPLEYTLLE